MSQPSRARFYFAFGHPECQRLLKREVELRYPELRLAFSRPGLVTFKAPGALDREFLPRLALVAGESLGAIESSEGLRAALGDRASRLHGFRVWQHTGDEEKRSAPAFLASAVSFVEAAEEYLDVVLLGSPETTDAAGDTSAWFGISHDPSGVRRLHEPVSPPEDVPSRAYSKLEEVVLSTGIALARGQRVLELGAAPGGATLALLGRGLEVVAVDPGEMAPSLASHEAAGALRHVKKAAGQLAAGDIGAGSVDWLVSDMNLAPPVAATQIAHAWSLVKKTARGAILTIKMNDERALEALTDVERRLTALIGRSSRVLHLPSHRREVALVIER